MGMQWVAKHASLFTHQFDCASCKHSVAVRVEGSATARSTVSPADAERSASMMAEAEAEMKFNLAKCPSCGRRNGKAVVWFFVKLVVGEALIALFAWWASTTERLATRWPFQVGAVVVAIWLALTLVILWSSGGKVIPPKTGAA
jgi:hypothetical protein